MQAADLKNLRTALKLTQVRLAAELGISLRTLKRYELEEQPIPRVVELALQTVAGSHGTKVAPSL
jgi:transcriptional regulator with XRE-family HTH domain